MHASESTELPSSLLYSTSHDSDLLLDQSNGPLHDAIAGTASDEFGFDDVPAAARSCSKSSHLHHHRHDGKLLIRCHHDVTLLAANLSQECNNFLGNDCAVVRECGISVPLPRTQCRHLFPSGKWVFMCSSNSDSVRR